MWFHKCLWWRHFFCIFLIWSIFSHSLRFCETLVLGAQELKKQASAVKPTAAPEDTLSEFLFSSFSTDLRNRMWHRNHPSCQQTFQSFSAFKLPWYHLCQTFGHKANKKISRASILIFGLFDSGWALQLPIWSRNDRTSSTETTFWQLWPPCKTDLPTQISVPFSEVWLTSFVQSLLLVLMSWRLLGEVNLHLPSPSENRVRQRMSRRKR